MATWTGLGVNYGHQTNANSSSYNTITTQVESDYAYLQSIGITRLRIAMPQFDSTVSLPNCQDMVTRALAHGFYVVWGVVGGFGNGTLTATRWASAKTYITGTLAPWAQSNGLSELTLTNESELAVDGTTLTAATVRTDIRSMATTIKANGFTGKITYSTSVLSTYRTPWANEGIGDLDYIAWNSYDTISNFNANKPVIVSQFGSSKTYISEFGSITNGQSDYASEQAYHDDVLARINSIRNAGIPYGYFFCYRDGAFGMPVNSFGLVQTRSGTSNGTSNGANWAHYALHAVSGTRLYALRTFGSSTQFGTGINAPAAEPLSLSESPSLQRSSSLASESVSVAETTPSLVGLPSLTDNVSLNELNTSSNTAQFIDNVSLNELNTLSNTIQIDAELTSIAENTSLAGQVQNTDNVQVDESNSSLQSRIVYAPRTFGSPVKYSAGPGSLVIPADSVSLSEDIISRKKYALRVFGSRVKYGVVANIMSISETTPISETVTLISTTTINAEAVSIAESPSLAGLPSLSEAISLSELNSSSNTTQFIDNVQLLERLGATKHALRVFGPPVQYSVAGSVSSISISESVGAAENVSLAATESLTSDLVQILEALSASGLPSFIDSAQISDAASSQSSSTIAAETISLSDILAQAGSSSLQAESALISDTTSQSLSMTFSDSTQIAEQSTFAANTSFSELTAISDVLALLGLPQFTENVLIGENGALQAAQAQYIDNVQLLESSALAGADAIVSEAISLTEFLFQAGLPQMIDNVQLSDALNSLFGSLSNIVQIKKYALRTFGSSVQYSTSSASSTDFVSAVEILFLQGSSSILAESIALTEAGTQTGSSAFIELITLAEAGTQTGSPAFSEAASLQEINSLAGAGSIASESVTLTEAGTQAGSSAFIELITLAEAGTQTGSSAFSEAASLQEINSLAGLSSISEAASLQEISFQAGSSLIVSEVISLAEALIQIGLPAFTEQLSLTELLSLIGSLQSTDTAPILEIVAGQLVIPADSSQLSDFLTLLGAAQTMDAASLSDAMAFFAYAHTTFKVTLPSGAFKVSRPS